MIGERHFQTLERLYRAAPSTTNEVSDLDVSLGAAHVTFQIQEANRDADGLIDRALYYKILTDAASLAAGSLVDDRRVVTNNFSIQVVGSSGGGAITAAARVLASAGTGYVVEAILHDGEGNLLAFGSGVAHRSAVDLPAPETPADEENQRAYGALWISPVGLIHQN